MASDYVAFSKVTDNLVKAFGESALATWITEADDHLESVAEEVGVREPDDIEVSPLHHVLTRYWLAYLGWAVFRDKIGTNNVEIINEKYLVKFDIYAKMISQLRPQISYEMVTGEINEIRDRATAMSGILFRS